MNTGAIGTISTHVNSLSTGVNAPVVAGNLSEGQVVDGLVGAVGLAEGMASIANRGNPVIGGLVGSYDLVNNLSKAANDATQTGKVKAENITGAAAALAGTIGGVTLAMTAAAVTTAALPVVLGAALARVGRKSATYSAE